MGNCLKTKLKQNVNNDNLEFLGFTKIHVCNNQNVEKGINSFTGTTMSTIFPVGSRIVGEGTFSTGKKIVEAEDEALIPSNTAFDVYVPKYTHFIKGAGLPSDSGDANISSAAINIDDFAFAFSSGAVTSINNEYGLCFSITNDGYKSKGNFENIVPYLEKTKAISLIGSDITLDLNTTSVINKLKLPLKIVCIEAKNVTGSLETFIRRYAQANKTDILNTTGNGRIAIYNSGIHSEYFDVNLDASIIPHFNSSNVITLVQSGKTVTYNIDTDTFSEQ